MGIRHSDDNSVALYDSTTDWAFGPVFESDFDADNFLRWADEVKGVSDVRRIPENELKTIHDEWKQTNWNDYDDDARSNWAPFEKQAFGPLS